MAEHAELNDFNHSSPNVEHEPPLDAMATNQGLVSPSDAESPHLGSTSLVTSRNCYHFPGTLAQSSSTSRHPYRALYMRLASPVDQAVESYVCRTTDSGKPLSTPSNDETTVPIDSEDETQHHFDTMFSTSCVNDVQFLESSHLNVHLVCYLSYNELLSY